ncbi:MAG: rod-binding protein [Candidatus Scalindua sp.]
MEIPFNSEFIINSAKAESSKNRLKNGSKSEHDIKKVAQDFEAVMLNMLIKAMWKTIPKSDLFEENSATQIYEGLIHSSLSEEMARNGGMGIAKVLYQQLIREQK